MNYEVKTRAVTTHIQKYSAARSPKPFMWLSNHNHSLLPTIAVILHFPYSFLQKYASLSAMLVLPTFELYKME